MEAVICSMTPKERAKPDLINAKRKIRIAKGSGTTVQEVNKLMKMHQEMEGAMKHLKKMGGMKGMAAMLGKMGGAGRHGRASPGCSARAVACRGWAACHRQFQQAQQETLIQN